MYPSRSGICCSSLVGWFAEHPMKDLGQDVSSTQGTIETPMSETSSRLLEMLSLLQGRRDWPGSELADRLEVSRRTIRRDVDRLRALGATVEAMNGPAGGA